MVLISRLLRCIQDMPFYAVARGRTTGVFKTWPECEAQVKGFAGPIFKKFKTIEEAENFIQQNNNATVSLASSSSALFTLSSLGSKRPSSTQINSSQSKRPKIDDNLTNEFTANIVRMSRHGKYDFMEDKDGFVHVYTDGACENNGKPTAVAGLGVYFGEGHALNTSEPVSGRPTNNCGEIQAATKAICSAAQQGITKLCINTDSHFVINSVTKWMKGWKSRGWKKADGKVVLNVIDFQELDEAIESNRQMTIKWQYVTAHKGILGNERADELAKRGAQQFKFERR